jgi:hypothetical protein
MTATATLSASEEGLPTFLNSGRSAGCFGPVLLHQAWGSGAGISPAATGADNVIGAYSLPANTLNYAPNGNSSSSTSATPATISTGGLYIRAVGHFGANANNKTVKIIFNPATAVIGSTVGSGGTTLVTSGVVAINGLGFVAEAFVTKIGAENSNTQVAGQILAQFGATFISPPVTQYPAAIENAAILIAVTGNAASTATDIVLDLLQVFGTN